jgi:hypothetical protein
VEFAERAAIQRSNLNHLRTLLPRLNDDCRRAILLIKEALATEESHFCEGNVPSAYVYDAVVDQGVTTVKQFTEWLATKKAADLT